MNYPYGFGKNAGSINSISAGVATLLSFMIVYSELHIVLNLAYEANSAKFTFVVCSIKDKTVKIKLLPKSEKDSYSIISGSDKQIKLY